MISVAGRSAAYFDSGQHDPHIDRHLVLSKVNITLLGEKRAYAEQKYDVINTLV